MVSVIIGKMSEVQKQSLIDADEEDILVVSEAHGELYCALVQLPKGRRSREIVARTLIEFDNEDDALKMAESVVDEVRGVSPIEEEEPEEDLEPETESDEPVEEGTEVVEGGNGNAIEGNTMSGQDGDSND